MLRQNHDNFIASFSELDRWVSECEIQYMYVFWWPIEMQEISRKGPLWIVNVWSKKLSIRGEMEGAYVSAEFREDADEYVKGEITIEDLMRRTKRRWNINYEESTYVGWIYRPPHWSSDCFFKMFILGQKLFELLKFKKNLKGRNFSSLRPI